MAILQGWGRDKSGMGSLGARLLLQHTPPQLYIPPGWPPKITFGAGSCWAGLQSPRLSAITKGIIHYHPLGMGFGGTGQGIGLRPAPGPIPAPPPIPKVGAAETQCREAKSIG